MGIETVIERKEGATDSGIHFRVTSTATSRDALLLIMGYGANLGMWPSSFVEKLAGKYTVITFDNRGAGQSIKPALPSDYTVEIMARDANAVIEKLGLAKIHLLGYSLGGCIALEYAHRYPSKVKSLFLLSTTAGGALHVKPRTVFSNTFAKPAGETLWDMYLSVWKLCMSEHAIVTHMDALKALYESSCAYLSPPESLKGHLHALDRFDGSRYLQDLKMPTTILVGLDDRVLPAENSLKIAEAMPQAKLVQLPDCEHYAHLECQEAVLNEIFSLCKNDLP